MGVHKNIGYDKFPKQGRYMGRKVAVCFNYEVSKVLIGTIVRDDIEDPGRTIIALEDGRYVEAVECQYSPLSEEM